MHNVEKELKFHKKLVKHLQNTSNPTNNSKCERLKNFLSIMGPDIFSKNAIDGNLPLNIQEIYDTKLIDLMKKSKT